MPCSEEIRTVSPGKRSRPAEEGGARLRFVRLSEHATAPTKGSARAAGYDLYRWVVTAGRPRPRERPVRAKSLPSPPSLLPRGEG